MLTYNELLREVKQRPPQEQWALLEELTQLLHNQQSLSLQTSPTTAEEQARGWPPGYFEQTYGSLRDIDLERPVQGEFCGPLPL